MASSQIFTEGQCLGYAGSSHFWREGASTDVDDLFWPKLGESLSTEKGGLCHLEDLPCVDGTHGHGRQ